MTDLSSFTLQDLNARQPGAARSLFEEAFSPSEREPFDDLVTRERDGEAAAIVLAAGGWPLAMAVTSCLAGVRWSYLEYFAVEAGHRGCGIGGLLWREVGRDLAAREQPVRLVLEVEDPAGAPEGSPERHARERRIRFYQHLGARSLLARDYLVPHLDGTEGSDPMLLLWAAVAAGAEPPSSSELTALLPALYAAGYELPPDHALVQAALSGASGGTPRR